MYLHVLFLNTALFNSHRVQCVASAWSIGYVLATTLFIMIRLSVYIFVVVYNLIIS